MIDSTISRLSVLFLCTVASVSVASAQANLVGDWQGTLDANGTTVRVAWHVTAAPDGKITSTVDNIDENIYGIKVKTTSLQGSDVSISVDDRVQINGQDAPIKGEFTGKLSANGNEVDGTLTQTEPQPVSAEITFKRGPAQPSQAAPTPAATSAGIVGDWEGTLSAGPAQLRLALHITAAKDGSLTGTLDSLDQGAIGIPVSSIELRGSQLTLGLPAVSGTYAATVNKDSSEIEGTWSQGQPLELNFKRAKPQAATPAPKPAAPSDIDGTWQGVLDTPGGKLRIVFKIVNMETGLTATAQSPDQGSMWMPTTSVARTGDKLTIVMKALGATFEGQINASKDTIDGNFTQGMSIPLVLKKI